MNENIYGGIEFGGTKTICATGSKDGNISLQIRIPTTTVDETLSKIYDFFNKNKATTSIGIGTFGPLNLDQSSDEFGYIYNTPKPGWEKVNLKGLIENGTKLAVNIDTDVNCAAIGEYNYGKAKDIENFVYITIGTGIGGSLMINGKPYYGLSQIEMGHMYIPHEQFKDSFQGTCTYHKDCFEGIASGHALHERYAQRGEVLTDETAWQLEANYISTALTNIMLSFRPGLIILGGGILNHSGLINLIREQVYQKINNYMEFPNLGDYIVQSSSNNNGVLGAINIAK